MREGGGGRSVVSGPLEVSGSHELHLGNMDIIHN